MDTCPDLETIAAYLDGKLSARERGQVAAHMADCESCYFVFTEAAQMRASEVARQATEEKAAEPARVWNWLSTPKIAWSSALGLAAAACLMLAVGAGIIPWRNSGSAEMRTLIAAVGRDRLIEARMTGGFAHGPMKTVRGADSLTPAVSPDILIAAAQVEKATADDEGPDALRERGVAAIVLGDVDRGITSLEAAASKRPSDARIQSDLAATYLTKAASGAQSQALTNALAAANRAVTINRTLPEALFNRALALERLGLTQDARGAWRAYLVVDDQSGWADEARAHVRSLEERR